MWTELAAAALGAVVGQGARHGISRWRGKQQDVDEWYNEALDIVSRAHGICISARDRSDLNYGNISEESYEIAHRLKETADSYPKGVDEKSVVQVYNLWKIFRKLSSVTEATEEKGTMEALEELLEMSQKESKTAEDVDMGKSMKQSTEYSPIMNNVLSELDMEPRVLGPKFRNDLESSESMEDLIHSFGNQLNVDDERVETVLERFLGGDEWDDSLSMGIRVHLQIASNLSVQAINDISAASKMESASV